MSSDETTWLNETEFEIQNQSERVNPETIKRNCSGVRKYRFYKSLGSTELKTSDSEDDSIGPFVDPWPKWNE